jgi:hypothetical protein
MGEMTAFTTGNDQVMDALRGHHDIATNKAATKGIVCLTI